MIELRWAQRMPRNPRAGPQTVLEYRIDQWRYMGIRPGATEVCMQDDDGNRKDIPQWSEWMPVPTVIVRAASNSPLDA